jgi:hypothetical protein
MNDKEKDEPPPPNSSNDLADVNDWDISETSEDAIRGWPAEKPTDKEKS